MKPKITKDGYFFEIHFGKGKEFIEAKNGTKFGRANFKCIMSSTAISAEYIRSEASSGRLGSKLMAIVAEGQSGRIYIQPNELHENEAKAVSPNWKPDVEFFKDALGFRVGNYGFSKWSDLFTNRQSAALEVFSDQIVKIKNQIIKEGKTTFPDDPRQFKDGGHGVQAYAEAIVVYLTFALDRMLQQFSTLAVWSSNPAHELVVNMFSRQTLSMTWDYGEINPFCKSASWEKCLSFVGKTVEHLGSIPGDVPEGIVRQEDAQTQTTSINKVISTDPPYYDNIGYADLSDYFYVWMRRTLKDIFPKEFSTVAVPKMNELVATPSDMGGKSQAESFFLNGMTTTFKKLLDTSHPAFPITIYYAFKQAEEADGDVSSTGWETFLEAIIKSGFTISGTWPVRTEKPGRMRDQGSNALASSIVLVCRKRPLNAKSISRRDFIRDLNSILPEAILNMTIENSVAPVDLSQAVIGPGMEIFSKYSAVIEADGSPMTVKTALQLINRFLAEDDYDHDSQFCLQWFETFGWAEGKSGEADVLARAKGTSIDGLRDSGVINTVSGKISLIKWQNLDEDWSPESDSRTSHWEMLHHLIRAYNKNGENRAGEILARIHSKSETIRALAYRLYTVCERKKYADDAANYNNLILAWESIEMSAQSLGVKDTQTSLFDNEPETKETNKKTKRKK